MSYLKNRILLRVSAFILLCAALLSLLFSCGEPHRKLLYGYFDTETLILDDSLGSKRSFEAVCAEVEALFSDYHRLCDIRNDYSGMNNLKTVNDKAGEGAVKVDGRLIELLKFSVEMYGLTSGEVNIAMGSVISLWQERLKKGSVPTEDELAAAAEHTDITKLLIDEQSSTVELLDPEMSLDLGAVAKGYAVEKAAELIKSKGLSGYAINAGGNVRAIGTKPDGGGWSGGIKNPSNTTELIHSMTLSDCALVTSGVYERFYTVGDKRYHHIIDGDTLMPSDRYLSVTVRAPSSALADALSTALFNMDGREIERTLEGLADVEVYAVTPDGRLIEY